MPTALIAEDEPLLAQALQQALLRAWPELQVLAVAPHGPAAVSLALQHRPDVLFLDVRMPGISGLEAAAELADRWADDAPTGQPFPALVLVTAYDQYALQAFDAQAVDYLLKPVSPERLARTVQRLQAHLAQSGATAPHAPAISDALLGQLRALLAAPSAPPAQRLQVIQASVGQQLHLVPVEDVLVFESADKYLRVLTTQNANVPELLIRTPLKDLLPQLDARDFVQIHRSVVVNLQRISHVVRGDNETATVFLKGRSDNLPVSRSYLHHFKQM